MAKLKPEDWKRRWNLLLASAAIGGGFVYWALKEREYRKRVRDIEKLLNGIPGDMGSAFGGESFDMATNPYLTDFVASRHKKYGSVFKTHYFGENVVFVSGIPLVEKVLTSEPEYTKSGWAEPQARLLGEEAITVVGGSQHTWHRKTLARAMNVEVMKVWIPMASRMFSKMGKDWLERTSYTEGKYVEATIETTNAVWNMTKVLFFGKDMPEKQAQLIKENLQGYGSGFFAMPIDMSFTAYGKALKSKKVLADVLEKEIIRRIRERERTPNQERRLDILGNLMRSLDSDTAEDGKAISVRQLAEAAVGPLWGSLDSTACLMTACLQFASENSEIMKKIRNEADKLIGPVRENGMYFYEELNKLPYLDACVKEVLRIYAPIVFVYRKIHTDMPIKWYNKKLGEWRTSIIPAGWTIAASLKETTRLNGNFMNKFMVEPERYLPPRNEHEMDRGFGHLPFSQGRRQCPGQGIATLELKLALLMCARNYVVHVEEPVKKFVHRPFVYPDRPLKVALERLKSLP